MKTWRRQFASCLFLFTLGLAVKEYADVERSNASEYTSIFGRLRAISEKIFIPPPFLCVHLTKRRTGKALVPGCALVVPKNGPRTGNGPFALAVSEYKLTLHEFV